MITESNEITATEISKIEEAQFHNGTLLLIERRIAKKILDDIDNQPTLEGIQEYSQFISACECRSRTAL